MKPSPLRAIPKGWERLEVIKAVALAGALDGVRRTLLLVLSATRRSPLFFWATPSLLPATPTSWFGVCRAEPRARFVTPEKVHNPDPALVLETTRSPVEVIRPHWGPVKEPLLS